MMGEYNPFPPGCNLRCPACSHRIFTAAESLKQKQDFLKRILAPWENVIQPVTGPPENNRLGYRNKVILHTSYHEKKWYFGMIHRDAFIPIMECPVHSSGINNTIAYLSTLLPPPHEFPLAFYVQTGKQVTLILKGRKPANLAWMDKATEKVLEANGIEGLWVHYNPSAGRRIFEKTPMDLLWGSPWSSEEKDMQYGPRSFRQLIPSLYHLSLQEACAWLNPDSEHPVIDLYSGTGNSLRYWTEAGSDTLGIELSGEAVLCARQNVPRAMLLRGKCSERIPQADTWAMHQKSTGREILLYANPPRTGIEPEVLAWIVSSLKPARVAYLSCSPGTLSKNLGVFCEHAYSVEKILPFDFFPLTKHVECLALLYRVK